MPTGYTAKLMEKGQTFQEFVMTCARGMGACIMMRDEPFDATIPERFEPSDYYAKKVNESRYTLNRLNSMTEKEREEYGISERENGINRRKEWLAKEATENDRLRAMMDKVNAWKPPTSDHDGLKEFMLQQLRVSEGSVDYINRAIKEYEDKTPNSFYSDAVAKAIKDVEDGIKSEQEEVDRTESRNKWLRDLRSSINNEPERITD